MLMIISQGYFPSIYEIKGVLGAGAFSQVRKVTHRKTRAIRAMKVKFSIKNKNKVINKSRLSTAEL